MKTIGIIGGLGPESTCEFYRMITRSYYDMHGDYNYPEIIIYSVSFKKFIDCGYESADDIKQVIERLHRAGADFVVAPCNTIHLVYEEVLQDIPIPWISIMDAAAENIRRKSLDKVGLLGTRFTMSNTFYRDALCSHGIETVVPGKDAQETINDIIFNELVTNTINEKSRRTVVQCIDELQERGAQGIVLGCTELPFLISQKDVSIPVFDTTALYAHKALELALG
ncbi:aspartate/glutamate racemase family protein [Candidatus Omnitrophota bacterium]